jgi:hypothetical protein
MHDGRPTEAIFGIPNVKGGIAPEGGSSMGLRPFDLSISSSQGRMIARANEILGF